MHLLIHLLQDKFPQLLDAIENFKQEALPNITPILKFPVRDCTI